MTNPVLTRYPTNRLVISASSLAHLALNCRPIITQTTNNQLRPAFVTVMRTSVAVEALEFAPTQTEASLLALNRRPSLSCTNTPLHRRHGERDCADHVGLIANRGVHARDQHQLSLIIRLSLNRNCGERQSRHSHESRLHHKSVTGI